MSALGVASQSPAVAVTPEAAAAQTPATPAPDGTAAPDGTSSPTATASPGATATTTAPKANSITDTEYVSVRMDANGDPIDVDIKEWYRIRREGGGDVHIEDPGELSDPKGLSGKKPQVKDGAMSFDVDVPEAGHADVYFSGHPEKAPGGKYVTADGPRSLPLGVSIKYYTGEPGADEATRQVNAREFGSHHGPFKLVITLTNLTKRTEEVTYTDVQTKQQVTAIAEVSTPFSVKIPEIQFPDEKYDGLSTNGIIGRKGEDSAISWSLYLAPPDFPNEQHAIVEGRANGPGIPKIDVQAQPVYPEPVAEALSSAGTQFQKGRRSFYYDVLNLLRENLIALGGLFSVLDDTFANLALPLIGPEKGNRDSGSFTDANLLWGMWTVAKGTEQLARATDTLSYAVHLTRNGVKGEIGSLQLLRAFIGKSTDQPALTSCVPPVTCSPEDQLNQLLSESMWANLKDLEIMLGAPVDPAVPGGPKDPRPYLPEAPASLATNGAVAVTILKLKLAILEHNFYCLVYEDHSNECASILGITNKPGAEGWDKYATVKYPFGQLEIEKGLRVIEDEGLDQIRQALGNRAATNSFIWGTQTLVEGIEALVDSFHQLGATWRYIADSVQNFGIFGIDTSRSILQLDINAIDIDTAAKAAALKRAQQASTFMGKPKDAQGQLVLSFSTDPEEVDRRPKEQIAAAAIAAFALVVVLALFARFRLFWL
ncbi:MAG TPA: hypothetical protein VND22_08635 [Actinomycetota bacterium]|nr:hypothetical protein [Actinomycetota bacterium]